MKSIKRKVLRILRILLHFVTSRNSIHTNPVFTFREWVNEYGLRCHPKHNKSFREQCILG